MSMLATCPQGHRWEIALGAPPTCPVCGAPGGPATHGGEAPTVHEEGRAHQAAPLGEATDIVGAPTAPVNAPPTPAAPIGLSTRSLPDAAATLQHPGPNPAWFAGTTPTPGYEILEVLGRGGMGVVYKARQKSLNRLVALKMISSAGHADASALARFRTEAEAVARLQHPNIVQVYDVGEHNGLPFFSMEYVPGGCLSRRLAKELPTPREAAALVETLAGAIHHAHERGVVHRDLKPGNVLLEAHGSQPVGLGTPKVSDFGLARRLAEEGGSRAFSAQTRSGDVLGTPSYMAPEQAAGRTHEAGPAADVWALGAILYECLTGRPPFEGDSAVETLRRVLQDEPKPPSRLRPGLPRDLQTICLKCLEKEPARRYASAEALALDLRAFLAGESITARPAGPGARLTRWARRRPTGAVMLAVGAVALVGVIAGAWWHSPLAAGGLAVLGLLAGAGWYSARLGAALREVEWQRALAERGVERLHLLLETTRRLIGVSDPDELLRLLGEAAARLTGAERATIFLLDRERGELWSKVAVGDAVGEIRVPLGKGIAGAAAATGETINLADPYADPRFNPEIDRRTGYTTRSLLTLPMAGADGRVVGVFQVLNKRAGAFATDDMAMLHALAASAARAVEHARRVGPPTHADLPATAPAPPNGPQPASPP